MPHGTLKPVRALLLHSVEQRASEEGDVNSMLCLRDYNEVPKYTYDGGRYGRPHHR
jgi:hypothetical protein